jgi:prevent-host-death family protein
VTRAAVRQLLAIDDWSATGLYFAMITVGSYEAKTHLPELLKQVEAGEEVLITRNGHPVARLVPADGVARRPVASAITELRKLRQKHSLGRNLTVRDLIDEGRR